MHVLVEPGLFERTVFEATRADAELTQEFQRAFACCYRELPGDSRDRAFAELHDHWFDRLGLHRRIIDCVAGFPHIVNSVERLIGTDARARARMGAELFGKPGRYAVVLALTPALLLDAPAFDAWARFELQHIEDMLDPQFEFDSAIRPTGETQTARDRTQERFALLWAISIAARHAGNGEIPMSVRTHRTHEIAQSFRMDAQRAGVAFAQFSEQCRTSPATHPRLLDWARDGIPGFESAVPGHDPQAAAAVPGAPCPLCRFPTFDWSFSADTDAVTLGLIQRDFPSWTATDGLCRRCAEVYGSCTVPINRTPAISAR